MSSSASRLSSSLSSSSRISRERRPTRIRSTGGHPRSPLRLLSAAIIHTALLFAAVMVAAASAHIVGAAEDADSTSDEIVFKNGSQHPPSRQNMIALMGHTASNSSNISSSGSSMSRSGDARGEVSRRGLAEKEECEKNPLWSRRVDVADYEYGCKEIEGGRSESQRSKSHVAGGSISTPGAQLFCEHLVERDMLTGDIQLVGNGKVRDVYFAEYRGKKVVVKTLRHVNGLEGQKKQLGMHRREVVALDALNGHTNIVNMLGLCGTTVVTEYFDDNFLAKIHRHGKEMAVDRIASLALDVARGMQALHETVGGVHMDMKPQQLLVDANGRGKVNDFNSIHLMGSRPGAQGKVYCPTHAGKPRRVVPWRSPENLAGEFVSDKADIYSLGMIFYSLLHGAPPYLTEESFKQALVNKSRPEIDPSWHQGFVKVIKAMWRENPADRPSARQVVEKLEAVLDELP